MDGFPQYAHSAKQGDVGVNIVSKIIGDEFGWLFRKNHQEHDFGIDGQIEVVTGSGSVTGHSLAASIGPWSVSQKLLLPNLTGDRKHLAIPIKRG